MNRPRKCLALLALALLWSCSGADAFFVDIAFPDQEAKDLATKVRVISILPGDGATCQILQSGGARPDDEGYAIEDQVTFDMPLTSDPRPLEVLEKGRRLFYAEAELAEGVVFVRGCTEGEAGGSGVNQVTINLEWIDPPCESDDDCVDDGLWCNGELHCLDHMCRLETPDCNDQDPCTQDLCNEELDRCEHPPVVDPPNQEGPVGDFSCTDGVDNDCDTLTDEDDPACKQCTADAECDDLNPCTDDTCETERCVSRAVADGEGCDDGFFCTTNDACDSGRCVGEDLDCTGLADECNAGACDEEIDQCVKVPVADSTACNDGLQCTDNDNCQAGVCTGTEMDCSAYAAECVAGVCNEQTGVCESQPMTDGSLCDDGEYCTVNETCDGGSCGNGAARDCSATGGGCVDGVCDEQQDACVGDPLEAGTECTDDLYCTVNETCDGSGNCTGEERDCSGLTNQCNLGICYEDVAACVAQPANQDLYCDDGLYCTQNESCQQGECTGGVDRDCDEGDPCTRDLCDEANDQCENVLVPDPGAEGLSQDGTCTDQIDNDCDQLVDDQDPDCQSCEVDGDCDDGNPCTVNTCNDLLQCETTLEQDGTTCSDGRFCTNPDTCTSGVCDGPDRDCSGQDDQCTQGVCDEVDRRCEAQPIREGLGCDDSVYCNVDETCQGGFCTGGSARDCSLEDDQCNTGVCDEGGGQCAKQPDHQGEECDDGLFCNVNEVCQDGACAGGQDRGCGAAGDECNDGVCNETSDQCESQPKPDGTECGSRSCQGTDWMKETCLDGGCTEVELEAACDDGQYCNGVESCDAVGGCQDEANPNCSDGVGCTTDSCNETTDGCDHVPDDGACDNGTFCDGEETCHPTQDCQDGPDPDCDDGAPCTTDSCDPGQDECVHVPNSGGCPDIHIGPAVDTCPHDDGAGIIYTCDYVGPDGITDAANAAPAEGARFLVYDDLGSPAEYIGGFIYIPGGSYLGAAPGVDPANVVISAHATAAPYPNAVIDLVGDNVHIENLTIICLEGCRTTITPWDTDPALSTGGHLIENITARALTPELWGHNSIQEPFYLGPDTTVRNSHFSGYFEFSWGLLYAHRSRIVNNTFVLYQDARGPGDLDGVQDLVIANNVFATLTFPGNEQFVGTAATSGLTFTGNLVEGFTSVVSGLDPGDASNLIQDNLLGSIPAESPLNPQILTGASISTGNVVPGEGVSLDGVDIDGQTNILPGAYQVRSALSTPRRTEIRVGESANSCNGSCDILADEDNEIQKAVWSIWPGGTISIYPSASAYAGNAIISWSMTIRGMGSQPEDVTLLSGEEHPEWTYYELWERHESVLTVLRDVGSPVVVENMTILVDAAAMSDYRAVTTEPIDNVLPVSGFWHTFRNLRIGSVGTSTGLDRAFWLGGRALVQDVLIHGDFDTCIRLGFRRREQDPTPETTCAVVNLTCRLTGTGIHVPQSALDVASTVDSVFANLAIEFATDASMFRAQRRSTGDTGTTALDVPISYTLDSATVQHYATHSNGYDPVDGTYTETGLFNLAAGEPFFVDANDSHLVPTCVSAWDNGVNPASVDPDLAAGTSLDGVSRAGRTIDRGCYEQGN